MTITRSRIIMGGTVAAVVAALGAAAIASAGGQDAGEQERPIAAADYQRAVDAALTEVPGRVTGTEADDEEGAYEVEVTRADGREVDVHLDDGFGVISTDAAPDEPGDRD